MSKQIKKSGVPVLRFPEFRDNWDWKILKNIASKVNAKNKNLDVSVVLTNSASYGIVRQDSYFDREIVTQENLAGYYIVDVDDFVYNPRISNNALVGSLKRNNTIQGVMSPLYTVFRFKKGCLSFFEQYFDTVHWHDYMKNIANTGARHDRLNISNEDFFNLPLPFPSIKEQQKIAACLSSLDELITAQAQKLEALKTHKKGLMQQLFPAEGETVPKLRFPEFQEAGEWEEKPINKISNSIFDGTHQTPTYTEEGIPFFSVENIVSGKSNKFISREDYLISTRKNKPEKGDILITRIGNIGFSAIVDWDYEFSIYVTLAVVKKTDQFDSYYLHCFFQSERYQTEIRSKSLLNAVPCKINMDELRKTKVLLPSKPEQQKIAACLSSLDELITAQTQKLEALKTHKKGLMQQLFPSNDLGK